MSRFNDYLTNIEKNDGVKLIASKVADGFYIGIKDKSVILLTHRNGKFCADAKLLPYILKELADIYNTYFATDDEQIKVVRPRKPAGKAKADGSGKMS